MSLYQVGRRRINPDFIVMDEEQECDPESAHVAIGTIVVTMARGRDFVLMGEEAETYRRLARSLLIKDPAETIAGGESDVAHAVDPQTGELLPTPEHREMENGS